jgi:hypothetical protein
MELTSRGLNTMSDVLLPASSSHVGFRPNNAAEPAGQYSMTGQIRTQVVCAEARPHLLVSERGCDIGMCTAWRHRCDLASLP